MAHNGEVEMNQNHEKAFNAWMDDYVNHPEEFADTTADALAHLRERLNGKEPTYGQHAAAAFGAYLGKVEGR